MLLITSLKIDGEKKISIFKQASYQYLLRLDSKSEFVIGDDVLRIHPTDGYNIHFPYKRGEINVHEDVGGSQTSILADLGMIWTHAIETLLEINRRDFEGYKVVLVISALYNRSLIKHFMTLLLKEIGFGQAFVLQDHVAATFGAGLGKKTFFQCFGIEMLSILYLDRIWLCR